MKKNIITLSSFAVGALVAFFFLITNPNSVDKQDLASTNNTLNLQADYIEFENLTELEEDADLVLIGKPTQKFSDRDHFNIYGEENGLEDFYTETKIDITQVIKSDKDIDLKEPFKVIEPITYIPEDELTITTEDYTALEENVDYVMFLKKNDFGDYGIIFNNAGKYEINSLNQKAKKITSNDKSSNEDKVKLKIWDEIKIKYKDHFN